MITREASKYLPQRGFSPKRGCGEELRIIGLSLTAFPPGTTFEDPQYRAQGNIQMTASRAGEITVPGVVPRLSETPGEIRRLGAGLAAQNEDVYKGLLELSSPEIEDLRISGVI
jgi:hypothetical protein